MRRSFRTRSTPIPYPGFHPGLVCRAPLGHPNRIIDRLIPGWWGIPMNHRCPHPGSVGQPQSELPQQGNSLGSTSPITKNCWLGISFDRSAESLQLHKNFRRLFQFNQRLEFSEDMVPIQTVTLADQNIFNVHPVFGTTGKSLQNHKIVSLAHLEGNTGQKLPQHRSPTQRFLKRKPSQCHINGNAFRRFQEEHPTFFSKLGSVWNSWSKPRKKRLNHRGFIPETAEEREVHVFGDARFTPALNRHPSDERERKTSFTTKLLGSDSRVYPCKAGLHLRKNACWATSPDDNRGRPMWRADSNAPANRCNDSTVSVLRSASRRN